MSSADAEKIFVIHFSFKKFTYIYVDIYIKTIYIMNITQSFTQAMIEDINIQYKYVLQSLRIEQKNDAFIPLTLNLKNSWLH